jgi:hypothetical protein
MTTVLLLVATLPCVYWTQGIETRATLEAAGIKRICVAPDRVEGWRAAGFLVTPITETELAAREALPTPGVTPRPGVASPTRSPWIVASGWRFGRPPATKYVYDVPAAKGPLALAEAHAHGADAVVKLDSTDAAALEAVGKMLMFLEGLPEADLAAVADFAVVDDGSALTGEVMNLLARRNLLFDIVKSPAARFRINIAIGSAAYPREEAADPSAFALKVRRDLTDEQRSLRLFGSEVVIGRLTGDGKAARLHLINYGGREIEGLRVRVRGSYRTGEAHVAGAGKLPLEDHVVADGITEFSVPRIASYAVIDLR